MIKAKKSILALPQEKMTAFQLYNSVLPSVAQLFRIMPDFAKPLA